jgi:hypothetical protein
MRNLGSILSCYRTSSNGRLLAQTPNYALPPILLNTVTVTFIRRQTESSLAALIGTDFTRNFAPVTPSVLEIAKSRVLGAATPLSSPEEVASEPELKLKPESFLFPPSPLATAPAQP